MNLKKIVASLLLFAQASNAFAIGQASTQVYADKIKSNAGGTINTNASGTVTIPNITDTLAGITSPTLSNPTFTGTTTFPGTSSVNGSGNAVFGGTGNIAGATLIGAAGSADSKSVFELQSTTKGFLPPRMTTAQKNAIVAPTNGLVVYDTDLKSIQVYNGTAWVTAGSGGLSYAADTGAANAYVITPSPAALAYNTGDTYIFKATNANTTASTLNVSALGVKNIKTPQVANLPANAILASAIVMVVYDGTQFQIISQQDPSRVSPLTTKGDTHTFSTVDTRVAVPGDYGRMVPDSNAVSGWRPASYTQYQDGAPTVQYIQYGDFENGVTTGWTATGCATITSGIPNCPGSGGTAFSSGNGGRAKGANTSSPAVDSSSLIAGTYAMNLATTGAGTAGDGYVSSAYTLDPKVRGTSLSYSFSYKVVTGTPAQTGASTDTYAVAGYDPTNNTFITPSTPFCVTKASGVGTCQGTLPTSTTTATIQLFIYSPVAPAAASSLLFDDVSLGVWLLAQGPPVTNWASYTPTTTTSNATVTGKWRRVGDSVEIFANLAFTGAASSSCDVSLPSGLSVDTTKFPDSSKPQVVGAAYLQDTGVAFYSGVAVWESAATKISAYGYNVANRVNNGANPVAPGNTDVLAITAVIPITGWDSNVTMLSSTSNTPTIQRVTATGAGTYTTPPGVKWIEVEAYGGGGGGGSSGTGAQGTSTVGGDTTFGTSLITAAGGGRGTTSLGGSGVAATINSPAVISGGGIGGAGQDGAANAAIATVTILGGQGGSSGLGGNGRGGGNGTSAGGNGGANTGGGGGGAGISNTSSASAGGGGAAGSYVKAVINNPSPTYAYSVGVGGTGATLGTGGAAGGNGGTGLLVVHEYYTSNPNIAIDGGVIARYTYTGTAAFSNATVMPWTTTVFDTTGSLNTTTAVYTVSIPGKYRVTASFATSSTAAATISDFFGLEVYKNTVAGSYLAPHYATGTGIYRKTATGSATISCVTGDTLEARSVVSAVNGHTYSGNGDLNWVEFQRVGN